MKDIVIATGNKGKINDFKYIFPHDRVIGITELLPDFDVEETGSTFEENAVLKAQAACSLLNKTVIADDSGLAVDALNGEPGIYSARYAGADKNDEDNIDQLLENMRDIDKRSAKFVCVIARCEPGRTPKTYRGECTGEIARARKGSNGFGYDPIFFLPARGKMMAELTSEEKAEISHRRKAIEKLKEDKGE